MISLLSFAFQTSLNAFGSTKKSYLNAVVV